MKHRGHLAARLIALTATAVAAAAPAALAQQLQAQPFATGLTQPVAFLGDPTALNRHFVVEQTGTIRILVDGIPQATPFLDLTARISSGAERGLLGMALDPNFATNRRFYVFFTRLDDVSTPCDTSNPANRMGCENGGLVVARFRRSPTDPLVVEGSSRFDFRWGSPTGPTYIDHSEFSNHNGGTLMFGPDGYLYIGTGDGGGGYDPRNRGQDPNPLLGKILRVDVNVPDSNLQGYQVPANNPFVDNDPIVARHEIWAFGMRNPWKYSFDDPTRGGTGAMISADVGQDRWEEINYEPAGMGGRNYGWGIWEGNHGNPNPPTMTPAFTPLVFPVYEYSHNAGDTFLQGNSITGGFVYRGSDLSATWRGRYFFADFAVRRIWSAQVAAGTGAISNIMEHSADFGLMNVSSFGVDQRGELYIVRYGGTNAGIIYRLCEFTVSGGLISFSRDGGVGTVSVTTQPGCAWSATENETWMSVLANAQATGSGTVMFRIDPSAVMRGADLMIAGQTVRISQTNLPPVHGDIDGNARADLLWQHTDGRLAAWLMGGTGANLIEGRSIGPGFLADTQWRIAASGDFDRDGNRDLIFQHQSDGRLAMWRMSGTVLLAGMALSPAQVSDTQWKIRAAADIDRDGWMDLIWQHEGNGSIAVWLMTGTQLRDGHLFSPGFVADLNWRIVGAGDMDFDGHADLLWQHQTNGMLAIWFMNGSTLRSGRPMDPAQVTDTNWKIRAVTDADGNGTFDLVWQNQVTGLLSLWYMGGATRAGGGVRLNPDTVSDTNWQIVGAK